MQQSAAAAAGIQAATPALPNACQVLAQKQVDANAADANAADANAADANAADANAVDASAADANAASADAGADNDVAPAAAKGAAKGKQN